MADLSDVTVAILAGGLGTRLRPVVGDLPKVLAPLHGRPYLTFLLDWLTQFGINKVLLLARYGAGQLRETLGDSHGGIHLSYSIEPRPLGTAGALRWALPHLSPTVLLLNGDSFCDVDLHAYHAHHLASGATASLLLAWAPDTSRFGTVEVKPDGRVMRFAEKQTSAGGGWVNGGVYFIQRTAVADIPTEQACSLERDRLPSLVARGVVSSFRSSSGLFDIGTPEGYAEAKCLLGSLARNRS